MMAFGGDRQHKYIRVINVVDNELSGFSCRKKFGFEDGWRQYSQATGSVMPMIFTASVVIYLALRSSVKKRAPCEMAHLRFR